MNDNPVLSGGRQLTETQLRRSLRTNILAGSIGMCWVAVVMGMPITLLLEALGASGVAMGALATVMQFALVMQLPCALLLDRLSARKPVWLWINLVGRAIWLVLPLLLAFWGGTPQRVVTATLACAALSSLFAAAGSPTWWSWITDLVPERLRSRFWGARQSWTMVAYLLATWCSGYALDAVGNAGGGDWRGFQLVFFVAAVAGLADILVHGRVPEPRHTPAPVTMPWWRRLWQPMLDPDFRRLTLATGVYAFAMGLLALGIVFLRRDYHATYSQLAAVTIVGNIGTVLVGMAGGYTVQRLGGRAFGGVLLLLAPLVMLAWFCIRPETCTLLELFGGQPGAAMRALIGLLPAGLEARVAALAMPQAVWVIMVASLFSGFVHGGIGLCHINLCGGLAPKDGRTVAMAVFWCTVGVIGAAASLIAGRFMDYCASHPLDIVLPTGTPLAFHHLLVGVHMILIWCVALPLQLAIRRRNAEPDFMAALSRLVIGSPLRAVTDIYALGSAVTSRRRAEAARTIGAKRTALAVTDLIDKLDDPSSDVREEAAFALGRIGSPEAIDALLRKLNDPNADLAPQIARALRQAPDPRSVDALVRKLGDPDRETRTESARTLGAIGDRRAAPSLLDLLEHTDDAKVLSASSEALARLGDMAAIYEILPRMKAARNPVLKRSLAVAIGDLLGEREGFYRVLVREQQARGSEADGLMGDLRRQIEHATGERLAAQRAPLLKRTREIQDAYDAGQHERCAAALFDLAVGLAALNWGVTFGGDAEAFLPDLVWRDERFGVGVWYLSMLRRGWEAKLGPVDDVDLLLGIYFLHSHGVREEAPRSRVPRAGRSGWGRPNPSFL